MARRFSPNPLCAVFGLAAMLASDACFAGVMYRTVAMEGDLAPGVSGGAVYSDLGGMSPPMIGSGGQVAFRARTAQGGGVWVENAAGLLQPVALAGDVAPGAGGGATFTNFDALIPVDGDGGVAFVADTSNVFQYGSWYQSGGSPTEGVVSGLPAGGLPGKTWAGLDLPASNGGRVVTRAYIQNGPPWEGIWMGTGGSVTPVVVAGDGAPGVTAGTFDQFSFPAVNAGGNVAMFAWLTRAGDITRDNDVGLWVDSGSGLGLLARTGSAAPGAGANQVFDSLTVDEIFAINAGGDVAFSGQLRGDGVSSDNAEAIWRGSPGSLSLVVRAGQQAPGAPAGVVFNCFDDPALAEDGTAALWAWTVGPDAAWENKASVWTYDAAGQGTLVALEGRQGPGLPAGVVFSSINTPEISAGGQVVFRSYLAGPGVGSANDEALWATTPDGEIVLVAREGDLFEVADGDWRRIKWIHITEASLGDDGRGRTFSDAGDLAFALTFEDNSAGIFVATVPEPASVALLAVGAMVLAFRRRR